MLHERGSSHGLTRIIRLAYHEHPSYVPLLRRSYELWHELEALAGEALLITTGSIEGGPEDGPTFRGSLAAAQLHDLPHEVLDPAELRRRFPAYRHLDGNTRVVFQPDGGFLLAERSLLAHLNQAIAHGAELHFTSRCASGSHRGRWHRERTDRATYEADRLVLWWGPGPARSCRSWRRSPAPNARCWPGSSHRARAVRSGSVPGLPARHRGRQPLRLPGARRARLQDRALPHHLRDHRSRRYRPLHAAGRRGHPASLRGPPLPGCRRADPHAQACIFTNSPDEHFLIDLLPEAPQVSIAAGFSGHGYKFCSLVGEVMADLARGRADAPRHRPVQPGPIRRLTFTLGLPRSTPWVLHRTAPGR